MFPEKLAPFDEINKHNNSCGYRGNASLEACTLARLFASREGSGARAPVLMCACVHSNTSSTTR